MVYIYFHPEIEEKQIAGSFHFSGFEASFYNVGGTIVGRNHKI